MQPGRGKDLFISLESAGGTLGCSQRAWAETILADLFARTGVDIVLSGHDHATETTVFKGVRYETLESLKMNDISPGYNILTYGNTIARTFVPVE
ncbi:MAG: hypothetical protein IKN93_03640 [Bacteroidales bacterium]|nr:hypothetical protein [Bacteroidales bacterium]